MGALAASAAASATLSLSLSLTDVADRGRHLGAVHTVKRQTRLCCAALLLVLLVVVVVPHAACGAMAALRQHKAKFVGVACSRHVARL